jgi:hypothetical protein
MYFWRINTLTEQLRRGPLPQAAALQYLLAGTLLLSAGAGVPGLWNARSEPTHPLEWVGYVLSLGVLIAGMLRAYRANGGASGVDFAARFRAPLRTPPAVEGWR